MLKCENVSFDWNHEGDETSSTLQNLSIEFPKGDFVSILGPSGCGKSTFLRLLCGVEQPDTGLVTHNGKPLTGPTNKIGMVFQNYALFPWLTVQKNVEFGLKLRGIPQSERSGRARQVIMKVGLEKYSNNYPHQLSGGMKQRTSIARVLANDSAVVLMDEPFGALDYQTRLVLQGFLLSVWEEFQKTIVFVTHHVDESILLSDRILLMSSHPGRIVEDVKVDLPRPRVISDPRFNDYRTQVITHLEVEVKKSLAFESL